jgi:hypothetical protein
MVTSETGAWVALSNPEGADAMSAEPNVATVIEFPPSAAAAALARQIEAAVEAAVAIERERCARVCRHYARVCDSLAVVGNTSGKWFPELKEQKGLEAIVATLLARLIEIGPA